MKKTLQLIADFLLAVLCCFVMASLFHSQFVLHGLTELGVDIELKTRLSSSWDDLLGLLPTYGAVILGSLLIGFSCVGLIKRFTKFTSNWLFPFAGLVAVAAALMAMQPILNITLLAGARDTAGFAAQCFAGLFGGWAFMYQRNKRA